MVICEIEFRETKFSHKCEKSQKIKLELTLGYRELMSLFKN